MSKRINSYQAVAAFVRGFFEAYARGIIDATIEGNDFSKKNDPKQIKQMMLEHYGADVGIRHARKHLGWYLDRHAPNLAAQAKTAIMTSKDAGFVAEALRRALNDPQANARQEAA